MCHHVTKMYAIFVSFSLTFLGENHPFLHCSVSQYCRPELSSKQVCRYKVQPLFHTFLNHECSFFSRLKLYSFCIQESKKNNCTTPQGRQKESIATQTIPIRLSDVQVFVAGELFTAEAVPL